MTQPPPPRRFYLQRQVDITGASGTGHVADGIQWPDGTVSIRWAGDRPSVVFWGSLDDAEWVHGHGGNTTVVWLDGDTPACDTCGHTQIDHPEGGFCVGKLPYGGPCGCDDYEPVTTGDDQ